jgi:hypothetical protein
MFQSAAMFYTEGEKQEIFILQGDNPKKILQGVKQNSSTLQG